MFEESARWCKREVLRTVGPVIEVRASLDFYLTFRLVKVGSSDKSALSMQ